MVLAANILIDGVAYGMVLFMIAVGLTITLGLMRVVNLAHGLFAMLGGYALATLAGRLGLRFEVAAILAVLGVALLALPLERVLVRRIYGRDELEQVLLTIGITFVGIALASILFGSGLTPVTLPAYLQGTLDLGFRVLPRQRLLVLAAGIVVLAVLWLILTRSDFGIRLRAAVDDAATSEAIGIDTARVRALTFALGAGLAALGGISGAELLPIEPYYPLKYLVLFLAVVAVGGLGTTTGTLAAALVLGLTETAAKYLWPEAATILFYLTMFVVLSVRPHGLFGRA